MHLIREEQTLFPTSPAWRRPSKEDCCVLAALRHGGKPNPHDGPGARSDGRRTQEIRQAERRLHAAFRCGEDYAALYAALEAFERDMREHMALENDVLFPRAIAMEERACGQSRALGR